MSGEEYAVVSNREEGDEEDAIVQQPRTKVMPCKGVIAIALACFCMGIVAGGGLAMLSLQNSSATTTTATVEPSLGNSNNNNTDTSIVSYGFLKTPRGATLLESLKKDLISGKEGVKTTLMQVQDLLDSDNQIASSCHPLVHMLGRAALQQYGFQDAFGGLVSTEDAPLLRICNAAYMHGIIEDYLRDSNNVAEDAEMINTQICKNLQNVEMGMWECHHGVGHGVLGYYRKQHDMEQLQGALQECQATSFVGDCENGLWMDHFASTRLGHELEPSSLHVCYEMANSKGICALYSPTEFLLHTPRAYTQAIEFCNEGFSEYTNLANSCIKGVGMQSAKENQHDYRPVEMACHSAPTEQQQTTCFREAMSYHHMTTGLAKVPKSLCENLVIYKDTCMKYT